MTSRRVASLFLAIAACLALPALASAETIVVNSFTDGLPTPTECEGNPGDCTLRQALDKGSVVSLPAGHYSLTEGPLSVTGTEAEILGAGARTTTISSDGTSRIIEAHGSELSLSGLTVTGGLVESGKPGGAGIAAFGSGVHLSGVAVTDSVAERNSFGGGIYANGSELVVVDSTISHNRNSGNGGGLFAQGSDVVIENSTIADNEVNTDLNPSQEWAAYGGGVELSESQGTLVNVTIAGNSVNDANGGEEELGSGFELSGGKATAVNTLIYGNSSVTEPFNGECSADLESEGSNLEGPPVDALQTCFDKAKLVADPLLGPLTNNGGETDTMALTLGSPAIDAGVANRCPSHDQRGVARPQFGGCDIGAFELAPVPPTPPPPLAAAAKPTISTAGKVSVKRAGKTFLVKPGISVACPAGPPCAVTLTATTKAAKKAAYASAKTKPKRLTIGRASPSVAAGKTEALTFKLTGNGAKLLREEGKLATRFEVGASSGVAVATPLTKSAKLKLPKPKAKSKPKR